jgi:hypothetical protein
MTSSGMFNPAYYLLLTTYYLLLTTHCLLLTTYYSPLTTYYSLRTMRVTSSGMFNPGDLVVIQKLANDAFIHSIGMVCHPPPSDSRGQFSAVHYRI